VVGDFTVNRNFLIVWSWRTHQWNLTLLVDCLALLSIAKNDRIEHLVRQNMLPPNSICYPPTAVLSINWVCFPFVGIARMYINRIDTAQAKQFDLISCS